jgi:hypothetical protein
MKIIEFCKLHKKKCTFGGLWMALGAYRGIKYYEFHTKKTNAPFFYTDAMIHGAFGIFIYVNPLFWTTTMYKETTRLHLWRFKTPIVGIKKIKV